MAIELVIGIASLAKLTNQFGFLWVFHALLQRYTPERTSTTELASGVIQIGGVQRRIAVHRAAHRVQADVVGRIGRFHFEQFGVTLLFSLQADAERTADRMTQSIAGVFGRYETVAHPSSRSAVSTDVGEPPVMITIRRTKADFLDGLVYDEALWSLDGD